MSSNTSSINETNLTVSDGESCEATLGEWVTGEPSDEKVHALSPTGGTGSDVLLTVQVPSCQNFALGDSHRKHSHKIGSPSKTELSFGKETGKTEESVPAVEEKTKPRSRNEEKSSEPQPIFSEFIEKLLFDSDPLFDDSDTEDDIELLFEELPKAPIDPENVSKTLKNLINHLEGLSKSLNDTKSSTVTTGITHLDQVMGRVPSSMDIMKAPDRPSTSFLSIQDGLSIAPRLLDFHLPIIEYPKMSRMIPRPKESARPSMTSLATIMSDETLSFASSGTSLKENVRRLSVRDSVEIVGARFAESSAVSLDTEDDVEVTTDCSAEQSPIDEPKPETLDPNSCSINYGDSFNPIVHLAASKLGVRHSSERWDILWVDRDPSFNQQSVAESIGIYKNLKSHQRVNHFPGSWGLGLKDLLAKNLNYMSKSFPDDYKFYPKTWILPQQILDVDSYSFQHPGAYFIIKPSDPRSDRDIKITKVVDEECDWSHEQVCQVYVSPLLVDGYKFDFRVYALVTSCDPLRVFVYNEGLARLATEKYEEPSPANLDNKFMHLTNTGVNIHSPNYVQDEFRGSMRRMSTVLQSLERYCNVDKIQAAIDSALAKTVIANMKPLKDYYQICFSHHTFPSACFEILGFDVMLDHQLNVHLLDVDCSPSFDCETGDPFEAEVKAALLEDAFVILNLTGSRRNEAHKESTTRLTLLERLMKRKHEIKLIENQAAWEDSHSGQFRKIYPPAGCKCYQKLVDRALKNPHII